jgi:hypothetical protein
MKHMICVKDNVCLRLEDCQPYVSLPSWSFLELDARIRCVTVKGSKLAKLAVSKFSSLKFLQTMIRKKTIRCLCPVESPTD